ncbi:MAG TPA: class I SAM-dependent methyltransferase [Anaerolineae bacterium]
MDASHDAYGREVYDYFHGDEDIHEIVERDDGYVDVSSGPAAYFAPYEAWPNVEQEAMAYAQGRVLDVGCGPGRVSLYLQEHGHEVLGIDNSPLAIEVALARDVKDARVLSITQASRQKLGIFDTIVMFGNNFGLFGNFKRAKWLLRRFYHMTSGNGRILAESLNPYDTTNPDHLSYHERNRRRDRMPGQARIRIRYKKSASPWFDYLLVSPEEMNEIVSGTGWKVTRFLHDDNSVFYVGVIDKI